ncbi:MAG: ubiquinol-cytochrome c reductase iron-sulfur subunit [Anaerolineales bacterium]|jgi:Rieske Fe-S protein
MNDEQKSGIERRQFMSLSTWAIGALIGAGMFVPAIYYLIGPALAQEDEGDWIRLGAVSKVELGTPTLFRATVERQTGWILNQEEITLYVLTEDGQNFIAMSNICTHLGCRVRWIGDQDQFFCPCHNAVFDKEGTVVSGPPPRPLERREVRIEDDQIYVRGG